LKGINEMTQNFGVQYWGVGRKPQVPNIIVEEEKNFDIEEKKDIAYTNC